MVNQQEQLRLQELGDFLRTRRARLTPEYVGFPRGARRRSPGLRRAEVAQLAHVSVDWYTWLEQGRSIVASIQVLESLVTALHLDADERVHLFFLARQQPPPERASDLAIVSPTLQRFLDQQGQSPALVSDARWDVLAWNDAACVVFGDFGQMTSRERNNVWRLFAVPSYRRLFFDWEEHARHVLAQFRASSSRFLGDPHMTELIHDLMLTSPEFRAWWPDHEVMGTPEGQKALNHSQAGSLLFDRLTFQVFDAPDLKVTVYTASEETDTAQKLSQMLNQWKCQKRQEIQMSEAVHQFAPAEHAERDSVGVWLEAWCERVEGKWVANSSIMASYTSWCEANGYEPKKAKGVAQSLAVRGLEIGVRQWVSIGSGGRTKARGVRGLSILHPASIAIVHGDR